MRFCPLLLGMAVLCLALSAPAWAKPVSHATHRTHAPAAFAPRTPAVPCPYPNPNLLGPGFFQDNCPLPAAGLNLAAPLASPHFTGTPLVNGLPIGSGGGGGGATPSAPNGSIQYNNGGVLGGYIVGPSLGLINGGTTLDLAIGAACFNLGPWSGDLTGAACSPPLLVSGAAARNLGSAGGALSGPWSALTLVPSSVFSAMGTPGGDLGGTSYTNPLVTGLYGFPIASTPPQVNSVPTWNGTAYTPVIFPVGINQTTGDVVCGPGSGTQPCAIQPSAVTNPKLAAVPSFTLKGNPTAASAQPMDLSIAGTLSFSGGALGLAPSGVAGQQVNVCITSTCTGTGVVCESIDAFGRTTSVVSGSCSGGVILVADGTATQLTGDDNATILTAESSGGGSGCAVAMAARQNIACNSPMVFLLGGRF
jgi:hypothetical protein